MRKLLVSHYQRVKSLYLRYERWLMPLTMVVGFLVDYFTFTNIAINTTLTILFAYWILGALTITFMHAYDEGKLPEKLRYGRLFAPLLMQYLFGALLGGTFIFYFFSGSVWVSWPLIAGFVLLMVSNDVFRHHFLRPPVQLSVYFFITLALFTVAAAFIFNSLNPWLFVLASAASLAFVLLFIWLLGVMRQEIRRQRLWVGGLVAVIFLVMNVFYYANIIPPIPLAVREAGVYHSVTRSGGVYSLKAEKESFWQKIIPGHTVHVRPGNRVYAYSAIFAPAELNTTISHRWQYYDEDQEKWVDRDTLSFTVVGGRKEGYRGYSWKSNLSEGKWRVYIETARGQTVGRLQFTVEHVHREVELEEGMR